MVRSMAKDFKYMTDCWYPAFLDDCLRFLNPFEISHAENWINTYVFDAALRDPHRKMNVTIACRLSIPRHPDWTDSPLQPLYARTGQDEERASWCYGNLTCRIGIRRLETWWVFKQSVAADRASSTYVLESHAQRV